MLSKSPSHTLMYRVSTCLILQAVGSSAVLAQGLDILDGRSCDSIQTFYQDTSTTYENDLLHMLHGPGSDEDCADCDRELYIRTGDVFVSILPASIPVDYSRVANAMNVHEDLLSRHSDFSVSGIPVGTVDISHGESWVIMLIDADNAQTYADWFSDIPHFSEIVASVEGMQEPCLNVDIDEDGQPAHIFTLMHSDISQDEASFERCLGTGVLASLGLGGHPFELDLESDDRLRNGTHLEMIGESAYSFREETAMELLYSGLFERGQSVSDSRRLINGVLSESCSE